MKLQGVRIWHSKLVLPWKQTDLEDRELELVLVALRKADDKNYHGEEIENSHTLHGLCRCSAVGVVRCRVGVEG